MTGLGMALKAFGVKISDEDIAQVEILLPQLPARVQQAITVMNAAVQMYDYRLSRIEAALNIPPLERIEQNGRTEYYGNGDTQRSIAERHTTS